jgi:tetratricopeptide (TPR) repeat protein
MTLRVLTLLLAIMLGAAAGAAAEPASLVKARELYNLGDYDGAIAAATEAQRQAEWADSALLVAARARLGRYRQRGDAADLVEGRQALNSIAFAQLKPRDQVDWFVGLGNCLFMAEDYGPATELFENALAQGFLLTVPERLAVLDWWANALDRAANGRPADVRPASFSRLATRMEEELRRDPANPVANYWLPVAVRGTGDLERAWDTAVSGWIRARLMGDAVESVRADLDRFVEQVLIPASVRTREAREHTAALQAMRDDWERVKQQWK